MAGGRWLGVAQNTDCTGLVEVCFTGHVHHHVHHHVHYHVHYHLHYHVLMH